MRSVYGGAPGSREVMGEEAEERSPDGEPTMEELQERWEAAKQRNQQRLGELTKYGRLDPTGVLLNRLEALLQAILDERSRVIYEIRFEEMMAAVIEEAISEAAKQALLKPGDTPPDLRFRP